MNNFNDLKSVCSGLSADEIKHILVTDHVTIEYNGHKYCDIASLFVCFAYLFSFREESIDRNDFRKNAYLAFIDGNRSIYQDSWEAIDFLISGKGSVNEFKVRILKGGSYKIKQYYLENDKLKDIRGASIIINYVEEKLIPSIIAQYYIPELIVYCGGGNILALLPDVCSQGFNLELEREASRYLVNARIAYYVSEPLSLYDLLGKEYRKIITVIDNKLSARKNLKLYNDALLNQRLDTYTLFKVAGADNNPALNNIKETKNHTFCESCKVRHATYEYPIGSHEPLCTSCLHKKIVGDAAKKVKYLSDYEKYNTNKKGNIVLPQNLDEIDTNHVAVIYADGNNMGKIVRNITSIPEMMNFSRTVKEAITSAVFRAMNKVGIEKYEVVGLGGDDVFVIVEGIKALSFTIAMINYYNEQFITYSSSIISTLSAGIAIAKTGVPIKVMLEAAEEQLLKAKHLARLQHESGNDDGSLSYTIVNTYDSSKQNGNTDTHIMNTLLPYSTSTAKIILNYVVSIQNTTGKTVLRNLSDAFRLAESSSEGGLFYNYINAKERDKNKITLPFIPEYIFSEGYYEKDNIKYYIWDDLIDLYNFCKGGDVI